MIEPESERKARLTRREKCELGGYHYIRRLLSEDYEFRCVVAAALSSVTNQIAYEHNDYPTHQALAAVLVIIDEMVERIDSREGEPQ